MSWNLLQTPLFTSHFANTCSFTAMRLQVRPDVIFLVQLMYSACTTGAYCSYTLLLRAGDLLMRSCRYILLLPPPHSPCRHMASFTVINAPAQAFPAFAASRDHLLLSTLAKNETQGRPGYEFCHEQLVNKLQLSLFSLSALCNYKHDHITQNAQI